MNKGCLAFWVPAQNFSFHSFIFHDPRSIHSLVYITLSILLYMRKLAFHVLTLAPVFDIWPELGSGLDSSMDIVILDQP